MAMRAGRMDRRIVLQSVSRTQDAAGEPIETWAALATVWADVSPIRGNERFVDNQEKAERTTRFRIRHRSDITADNRISYGGNIYDIEAVMELGREEGLEILTSTDNPS